MSAHQQSLASPQSRAWHPIRASLRSLKKLQSDIWLWSCQRAALSLTLLPVSERAPSLYPDTLLLRTHFSVCLLYFVFTSISSERPGPRWGVGWTSDDEKGEGRRRRKCRRAARSYSAKEIIRISDLCCFHKDFLSCFGEHGVSPDLRGDHFVTALEELLMLKTVLNMTM